MKPLASPIHISISSSRLLANLVIGGHLPIILALVFAIDRGVYMAAGIGTVMISYCVQFRNSARLREDVSAILLGGDGQWNLVGSDDAVSAVKFATCLFVSAHLVVLRMTPVDETSLHIALTDDNTPPIAFRRLRIRMRIPN